MLLLLQLVVVSINVLSEVVVLQTNTSAWHRRVKHLLDSCQLLRGLHTFQLLFAQLNKQQVMSQAR